MKYTPVMLSSAALLFSGCYNPSREPGAGSREPGAGSREPGAEASLGQQVKVPGQGAQHDFGTVLSDGRPLGVVFQIENPSGRPLRVVEGNALSPCCSVLGDLPSVVAARASGAVPTWLRTKDHTGLLSADFVIRTDDPDRAMIRLALRAHVVRAVEWEEPETVNMDVLRGRPFRKRIQLLQRRKAGQPFVKPLLMVPPGVEVVSEVSTERHDGLTESNAAAHSWTLKWPPSKETGRQIAEIRARWPNGDESATVINWDVVAVIRTSPRALLLRADKPPLAKVVLRSSDGVFRITQVTGACVEGHRVLSGEGTDRQEVEITLTAAAMKTVAHTIRFVTDRAEEPIVPLSVLVVGQVGPGSGASR